MGRGLLPARVLAVALFAAILAQPGRALPLAASTPTPTRAPDNLLHNGGFEETFTRQRNPATGAWANGRVAEGWTAWWRRPTGSDGDYPGRCPADETACQPWHEPEYRETRGIPYNPPRIHSGDNSQMYFTTFGVHEGGLYQRVTGVPPGWRVAFDIWARAWSSDDENTSRSDGQPSLQLRVGIDPSGGLDPFADSVIWSDVDDTLDEWVRLGVSAVAQSDRVTVFFRSRPQRALKHVDVVVDDAALMLLGPPPPTPVIIDSPNRAAGAPTQPAASGGDSQSIVVHIVQPGDTLFGIAQTYRADLAAIYELNGLDETSVLEVGQSIRVPLGIDAPPTPEPTAIAAAPEPAALGSLCVTAFYDAAEDGRYNPGDALLPGTAVLVSDGRGRTVAASNSARCFDDLAAGTYQVSAQLPAGYQATTDQRWGVSLTAGARVEVAVGARPVAAPDDSPSDSSAAVIAIGIAVAAVGVAVIIARRRPKRDE